LARLLLRRPLRVAVFHDHEGFGGKYAPQPFTIMEPVTAVAGETGLRE
jgi:hypothetical protein